MIGTMVVQWAAAQETNGIANPKDRMSYAIGMTVGNNIKRGGVELNLDMLTQAIRDMVAGNPMKLTDAQVQEALRAYQTESQTKREEERKRLVEKNKAEGSAYLATNKTKPGVKVKEVTLPDGKTAELQYKVGTEGTGATPKTNDMVSVNYKGTLINGTEFDSSAKHGGPAKFQANRVIRGWTEALQMMKVGSKWELYIPAELAYGDFGSGQNIEPGAALIFEVELLGIEPPPAPPTATNPSQPLTSDIIKVPSAEELKKGAKVEVLKAEDVEKQMKAATNKPAEKK